MSHRKHKERESFLKIIAITVFSLLGLSILSSTLFTNNSSEMGNGINEANMYLGGGTGTFEGIFTVVLQLLWIFVIVTLIAGLCLLLKKIFSGRKPDQMH